jgi:hypothetical protein
MAETCSCSISDIMEVVYRRVTFLLLRIVSTAAVTPLKMSLGHRWQYHDRIIQKYWGAKPLPVSLLPLHIFHGLTGDRTRISAVTTRQLASLKAKSCLKLQFVPRSKHPAFRSLQSILYTEVIAVCSEIHTKHIHSQCGYNMELFNVKREGA